MRSSIWAAITAITLSATTTAAVAQDGKRGAPVPTVAGSASGKCRKAMERQWVGLLEASLPNGYRTIRLQAPPVIAIAAPTAQSEKTKPPHSAERIERDRQPQSDPAEPEFENLKKLCADDRLAQSNLSSLQASRAIYLGNFAQALDILDHPAAMPGDPLFGRNQWMRMDAHFEMRDKPGFLVARDAAVEAHDAILKASSAWAPVERFSTKAGEIRVYQDTQKKTVWLFVVSRSDEGLIESVVAHQSPYYEAPEIPRLELIHYGCNVRGYIDDGGIKYDDQFTYEKVKARVVGYFNGTVERYQNDNPWDFLYFHSDCAEAANILPGFGETLKFTGSEYRAADAVPTEAELNRSLNSNRTDERTQATKYVLDHPDAVEPMSWIPVIGTLLMQGNNEQAAFWYLIFQIRTQPWREGDPSGYGALYASISSVFGQEIMQWAGSDRDALMNLYRRAISYERKIPLYPGRPNGVSETAWKMRIAKSREDHRIELWLEKLPEQNELEAKRRQNGFYVGPWRSRGEPLHDDWR